MFFSFAKYLLAIPLVLLILIRSTNAEHIPEQFVVGGITTDEYNLGRYMVSIQRRAHIEEYFGYFHVCGGSIIGKNKILTAAHCLCKNMIGQKLSVNELVVVVGIRNRFTRTSATRIMYPSRLINHKDFNPTENENFAHDIGLIKLKEDIVLDGNLVAQIGLPRAPSKVDQRCMVVGWGRVFYKGPIPAELNFAEIPIISTAECKVMYDKIFPNPNTVICAGDRSGPIKDACHGDSGGPLIYEDRVVGIVSTGHECGDASFVAMYTDVYQYLKWIESEGTALYLSPVVVVFIFLLNCLKYILVL